MNVRDLLERLQEIDPDMPVTLADGEPVAFAEVTDCFGHEFFTISDDPDAEEE